MSDDLRNLFERDQAQCSQALHRGRDVLLRAGELIRDADRVAKRR
jgi:hypothetical protein